MSSSIEEIQDAIAGEEIDMTIFFNGESIWEGHEKNLQGFEPVPAGTYNVTVATAGAPVMNKAGTGWYIKFGFVISDGEYEGRYIWSNLSLMDTARWRLQQLWSALGVEPGDESYVPNQFDGIPLRIQVKIRPAANGYEASNDVVRYLPADDSAAVPDWAS